MKYLTLLPPLLLSLVQDPGGFSDAARAYEAGRFREALAGFTALEAEAGATPPLALLHNRALAALGAGDLRVAELAAEKAAALGGAEIYAFRDFVRGNAAYVRAARAKNEASLMGADPTALGRAIADLESACAYWQRAALRRDDWPAARRNIERALRELEELRRKKAEADREQRKKIQQPPPPPPEPESEDPERTERKAEAQKEPQPMTAAELARLLEQLARIEQEKRALRAEHGRRGDPTIKDW